MQYLQYLSPIFTKIVENRLLLNVKLGASKGGLSSDTRCIQTIFYIDFHFLNAGASL